MKSGLNGTDYLPSTLCTYRKNFRENFKRQASLFFFGVVSKVVLSCFASLLSIKSLTHPANYRDRNLNFGYRQDTKQVVRAGQKPLSGANCLFYNKDIWVKKVFFLLFPKLLPWVFPAKFSAFDASKYCSKNRNAESWRTPIADLQSVHNDKHLIKKKYWMCTSLLAMTHLIVKIKL